MNFSRSLLALTCVSALVAGAAGAAERTIIVLDASGSMWGQIDGTAKIEIARDVLTRIVGEIDPSRELGLIAYGHRRKGQCSDIELVVPPKAQAGSEIIGSIGGISPKGKTPLSQSVRQAAEALRYQEDKATVVLVTDGLETCNADPCALGRELETAGVDFTAHVVGFGLTKNEGREVACLADETGGLYLSAANADELTGALSETVKAEAPVDFAETPAALLDAALSAPDSVEIAQPLDVGWEGPGDSYDRVEIFDPSARSGEGRTVRARAVRDGDLNERTVRLIAPAQPGAYTLRYFSSVSRQVLAERPLEVTPAEVVLIAPDSVPLAKTITVEWIGPGAQYDDVQIFDPSVGNGGKVLRSARVGRSDAQEVQLSAPGQPGTYELRYWNGTDRIALATRSLDVTEALVSLTPEDGVLAGKAFVTDWIGPGARYDDLEIWDMSANGGAGKKLFSRRLVQDDIQNQRATMSAPAKPGTYELRYWNGENKMVLAAIPLEVGALDVSLDAPEQIGQGLELNVAWQGPGARYDDVQIFDPSVGGAGKVLRSARVGRTDEQQVTLAAPVQPGAYELRYWNGESRAVLATRPIEVVPIEISLDAPSTMTVDTEYSVSWKGPGGRYDDVQIFDPSQNKSVSSRRVRDTGGTVTIKAPKQPGAYILRYWNGDNKAVLAEQPLIVQ
ncbi:MAG: VWA domain-containing protein [Pseudomonadota bacterium]